MEITLKLADYVPEDGFVYDWEQGFVIECKINDDKIFIKANKAGLISLAKHLLSLSQDTVPAGIHLHLDEYNSLENQSNELIIEKL